MWLRGGLVELDCIVELENREISDETGTNSTIKTLSLSPSSRRPSGLSQALDLFGSLRAEEQLQSSNANLATAYQTGVRIPRQEICWTKNLPSPRNLNHPKAMISMTHSGELTLNKLFLTISLVWQRFRKEHHIWLNRRERKSHQGSSWWNVSTCGWQ